MIFFYLRVFIHLLVFHTEIFSEEIPFKLPENFSYLCRGNFHRNRRSNIRRIIKGIPIEIDERVPKEVSTRFLNTFPKNCSVN